MFLALVLKTVLRSYATLVAAAAMFGAVPIADVQLQLYNSNTYARAWGPDPGVLAAQLRAKSKMITDNSFTPESEGSSVQTRTTDDSKAEASSLSAAVTLADDDVTATETRATLGSNSIDVEQTETISDNATQLQRPLENQDLLTLLHESVLQSFARNFLLGST